MYELLSDSGCGLQASFQSSHTHVSSLSVQATKFIAELETWLTDLRPIIRMLQVENLSTFDLLLSASQLATIDPGSQMRVSYNFEQTDMAWDTVLINGETVTRLSQQ
jgi:hypothetical protein